MTDDLNSLIQKSTATSAVSPDTSMDIPKRVGFIIFFLVFGVFGVWAAVAPLDGAARAPGMVMVKSNKKSIQHLEGGIVSDIRVVNGDFVNEGDVLLTLDPTQVRTQLEIVRSQNIALKTREARLIAERDGLDQIQFPASLDMSSTMVRDEVAAQNQVFKARRDSREGEREVLQQRIEQLQSRLVGLRAQKESKEELARSYAEELEDIRALLSQGFSDKNKLRSTERSYATQRGDAAELTSTISTTEVQIGETRLQILQLDNEFQNQVVSELSDVQTALNDSNERLIALQDVFDRTIVRAPASGVVLGMQAHTIGGVIGAGTVIAEIVPQSDELVIEARVQTIDIDRVAEGQEAVIRFSSFSSTVPTITGKVTTLSADAITDRNTGATFYLARIEVTPEGMEELGNLTLLPGMPAEAFINTGSRTFLQYTIKPFTDALARSFIED